MQQDKGFKVGDVVEVKRTSEKSMLGKTFVITQRDVDVFNGRIPSSSVKGEVYHFNNNKYGVNFTLDMLKLVEPKQEQYYISIPTDVKVGDKFEVCYINGINEKRTRTDIKTGDIFIFKYSDKIHGWFTNSKGGENCLDWGWLKPVEEEDYKWHEIDNIKQYPLTPDKMIKPKVGDKVLLRSDRGSNWASGGSMDKYCNTVQQIYSINSDSCLFTIKDNPDWTFLFNDIVKIITDDTSEPYEFKVGDEVELIEEYMEYPKGTRGVVTNKTESITYFRIYEIDECVGCYHERLKLVNNKTNNNYGKVHSNTESTFIFAITPTISTGSISRGTSICSSGKEITLGS